MMTRRGFFAAGAGAVVTVLGGKAFASTEPSYPIEAGGIKLYNRSCADVLNELEPKPPGHCCPICTSEDIDVKKERKTHLLADCKGCGSSFMLIFCGGDAGRHIVFSHMRIPAGLDGLADA
jgi:hypothetical protein